MLKELRIDATIFLLNHDALVINTQESKLSHKSGKIKVESLN